MAVYFYYGDEDFNIEQAINEKKNKLDKNFLAMNYKRVDNPDFPTLINVLRTQGMMFGNMLIVINCTKYFEKKETAFSDSQLKEIEDTLALNTDNIDIVLIAITDRDGNNKIDTRKKLFKIFAKYNKQEFPAYKMNYYGKKDLAQWIIKCAKEHNVSVDISVAEYMIEQIGNNLRLLNSEIEKLKLLVHPKKIITEEVVKNYCVSNEDLFAFAELLMSNNSANALSEYRKLLSKRHPLEIITAIQTILRKRILLKLNIDKPIEEIMQLTAMSEKQITAIIKNSKNQSLKHLVKLKEKITSAEYKIKSGLSANPESELEYAFVG